MTTLDLGSPQQAFARGGNRLCFIDPQNPNRCIKVLRPDRSPAIRRAEKSFPKNLKPLSAFDDNLEESRVIQAIDRTIGEPAYQLTSRCYGFVETNFGPGLRSELIRDEDRLISITLKQYLWQNGVTAELSNSLVTFCQKWQALGMPSRNLLLHNIVVQQGHETIKRLVVIDGIGWAGIIPLAYRIPSLARYKAARKVRSLHAAIEHLLHKQTHQLNYGYHGWITDDKRKLN